MKSKIWLLGAMGVGSIVVAACGGSDDSGSPAPVTSAPASTTMSLATAQVLTMAQQSSESSAPIAVDSGAVTLTDTSETSESVAVNPP